MLIVVGGIYGERSKEGDWNQVFGSGLRAAAAISGLGEVVVHGYASDQAARSINLNAATLGVTTVLHTSPQTLTFAYEHPLAVPQIFPPLHTIDPLPAIKVTGDKVLRFGIAEGDAVVEAQMVVYDPQSTYSPATFRKNGSNAARLSIVCNRLESRRLTGIADVHEAARALLRLEGAEAVVIKCASHGAFLATNEIEEQIPAFRTDNVWPIGSGDVYAAAYFANWAHAGKSPKDAAITASMATAKYCQTRVLPVPDILSNSTEFTALKTKLLRPEDAKPRVYLAGPFFNMSERWMVNEARTALYEQGLAVFSPYHDVGIGEAPDVVDKDIAGLEKCDIVFALLDHLDAGTLFEIGYARKLGIPVVGFCQNTPPEPLKMLVGTECDIVGDFVSAVYRTAWKALAE